MMTKVAILLGMASPLLTSQLVKVILLGLERVQQLASETVLSDATIVQSAIDLTTAHAAWVAIALAAFAVYCSKTKPGCQKQQAMQAAGYALIVTAPASAYLLQPL